MATTAVTTPDIGSVLSGRVRRVFYALWAGASVAAGAVSVWAGSAGVEVPWLAPTLTTLAWLGAACGLTAASHTPTAEALPGDTEAAVAAAAPAALPAAVAEPEAGTVPAREA